MATQHDPVDLTTLEDVERLLRTTEFASVDRLARSGLSALDAPAKANRKPAAASVVAEGGAPLPRRR